MTGKGVHRGTGYGFKIAVTYTFTGLEKTLAWIKRKISGETKTSEKMENNCSKWNSRLCFFQKQFPSNNFE